mmetsp:Transcript_131567/g.262541  ORF Transcript_131567/g.262541 Transcript_131567/m.262541 type:complete len:142 (-) Transcript_131567:70-495(-)
MALLAAGAACGAPCGGAVASLAGGSLLGPAGLLVAGTVVTIPVARRLLSNAFSKAEGDDTQASEDSDEGEELTKQADAPRIRTTITSNGFTPNSNQPTSVGLQDASMTASAAAAATAAAPPKPEESTPPKTQSTVPKADFF